MPSKIKITFNFKMGKLECFESYTNIKNKVIFTHMHIILQNLQAFTKIKYLLSNKFNPKKSEQKI